MLIVSKEEFQIGYDAWGFPFGALRQAALALVPEPPEIITAFEIATRLSSDGERPTKDFFKAVQGHLREMRKAGVVVSGPLGGGSQLAWQLPRSGQSGLALPAVATPETSAPAEDEDSPNEVLEPALQRGQPKPVTRKAFLVERRKKRIIRRPGSITPAATISASTVTLPVLRERVLSLVPSAPDTVKATVIAKALHQGSEEVSDEAVRAVMRELRALQMRQLARAVHLAGETELGWQKPLPGMSGRNLDT